MQGATQKNTRADIVSGLNHDRQQVEKPLGERKSAVRRQKLMVLLANIGILSTGMALALPSATMDQLLDPVERIHLDLPQFGWFASLHTLSCPFGGLLSACLLDRFGRKNTLYVMNTIALTAWIVMALTVQEDPYSAYIQLLVSRFIIGISSGLSTAPAGVYSAEISMPRIRGSLILGTSIAVAAGITLMYLLGYLIRNDWHLISLLCCAYQLTALLCLIPIPESPSWLLSKNRVPEAIASLNFFRGLPKTEMLTHPEVISEFNTLQKSIQVDNGSKKESFLLSLRLPEVYKPLLILIGLFAFQQLTGIFVVVVYAAKIAIEAGVSIDPFLCAIFIGLARVITTCLMGSVLEKGRRRAGLISSLGMCVCMFLLAGHGWSTWLQHVPYLPLLAIISFIILSTIGLYTLPFIMISELFPQKVRGPASGICVAVAMLFAFVCIKMYPFFRLHFSNEICLAGYGCAAFLAAIFVYLVLPETRGRTLLEIEEYFRSKGSIKQTANDSVELQEVFLKTENEGTNRPPR